MARGGRTVRASEIGTFVFCQRAWWYQRLGKPLLNKHELAAGSQFHHRHHGRIRAARLLNLLGWLMLTAAAVIVVIFLFMFLQRGA